ARVVPGGNGARVPRVRPCQQRAELDVAIAGDAWHRGAAGAVLVGEARDDRAVELALAVEEVVGDTQRARHSARVGDGVRGAAAPEATRRILGLAPRPHAQ